jgi:hypothetical protein
MNTEHTGQLQERGWKKTSWEWRPGGPSLARRSWPSPSAKRQVRRKRQDQDLQPANEFFLVHGHHSSGLYSHYTLKT